MVKVVPSFIPYEIYECEGKLPENRRPFSVLVLSCCCVNPIWCFKLAGTLNLRL
jgi:hypothetical protein